MPRIQIHKVDTVEACTHGTYPRMLISIKQMLNGLSQIDPATDTQSKIIII